MKKGFKSLAAGVTLLAALTMGASAVFAGTVTVDSDGANTGKTAMQIFQTYFGSDPIDGPTDSTHIRETSSSQVGNVFQFHLNNSGDYDGSNTDRQRVELKAYNSSPSNVKALQGETVTYSWKFRVMNDFNSNQFCHIFQLKASGGDDGAPILTFSFEHGNLEFRHSPIGADMSQVQTLASTPKANIISKWVQATITVQNTDSGKLTMSLKDVSSGSTLMSYSGTKDLWRTGADFNRPKWGIYRKIYSGMPTADIQFAHFQITK